MRHPGRLDAAEDADLVACALDDSSQLARQAYGVLVVRHETWLLNFLRFLSRDADLAQDLCQDAFVLAWQKLADLKEPEKFGAWLKRLAHRLFLRELRHREVVMRHRSQSS